MPVVTREEAEAYAKENQVTLMEAKEILMEKNVFRMAPLKGYKMTFDQDGFYLGTEAE